MDSPFLSILSQYFFWDICVVVSVAVLCMVGITVWLIWNRYHLGYVLVSWLLFLFFLTLGSLRAIREEQAHHSAWASMFKSITHSFASATEAMGHAKITPETKPDDPIYQNILKLHASWCQDFPMISYVFTLRLRENETNKVYWIVCCESDIDGDGKIAGPAEYGEDLYEPYDEWFAVYQKGFDGEIALDEHVQSGTFGDFVTAVAPLRDPENSDYIEGIIGVDFNLEQWHQMIRSIRFASAQFLALILFLYLAALYFIALMHRTILRVSEANRELLAAKKAADAAARAKSDFLANMSHEIRTPMNALVGFTEILTQRIYQNCGPKEREESEGIMEIIQENGRLLLRIINDILDFSRIEANLLQVDSAPVSIKQLIEEIWQEEMSNVVAKHLDFSVKYKEPIPELILSDATRLRQILINLIGNAIKFTEKGTVTIQCETFIPPHSGTQSRNGRNNEDSTILHEPDNLYPDSTMLKIDVIDSGIGIAPPQLEKLFQPFTQLDTSSTRRFGGTGLGLSIAKRLAELMDGDITATSELGVGSVFTLLLHVYLPSGQEDSKVLVPLKPPEEPGSRLEPGLEIRPPVSEEDSLTADPELYPGEHPLRNGRILLVEDMVVNQLVISTQLKDAGAMVEIAGNGEDGVQKILQDSDNGLFFDVVLMDMQMPIMDGYEATALLRQQGYTRPIIAITAHALTGDREKTMEAGCDDYIAKPVDRKVLIDTIRKYMK